MRDPFFARHVRVHMSGVQWAVCQEARIFRLTKSQPRCIMEP